MNAVLDACYRAERAVAACVVFDRWEDGAPQDCFHVETPIAAAYRPGRFYERELPVLMALLHRAGQSFETILIDGYVHLAPEAGKGLGLHLFDALAGASTVIGVAKNPLRLAARFALVWRGRSRRPLFVSAAGCPARQAAAHVARMHGPHRIPTLLRLADQQARAGARLS